jgi:hypothetical protein
VFLGGSVAALDSLRALATSDDWGEQPPRAMHVPVEDDEPDERDDADMLDDDEPDERDEADVLDDAPQDTHGESDVL